MMFSPFLNTLALSLSLRKRSNRSYIYGPHIARSDHRENQVLHDQVLCRGSKSSSGFLRRLSQGGGRICAVELLCFGIAPVSLTKPFQKGWSCQDSNVLFGKVLWGWLAQIPKQRSRPPASLAYRQYWWPLPLYFDFLCGRILQTVVVSKFC